MHILPYRQHPVYHQPYASYERIPTLLTLLRGTGRRARMFDPSAFHPEHLADLRKSGLSDETIEQAGLYSVRPNDIKKVTGIAKVESMLAIPYTPEFTRYKVFPTNLKVQNKKFRYTQPTGTGVHIYVPPAARRSLQDTAIPLGIVEGEKKALKACQEGVMCVAIGGLWNWLEGGTTHPRTRSDPLEGPARHPLPDSDVWKRQDLLEAVYRLGQALEAEGAQVDVCALGNGPGETKQGLDDFLCEATTDDLKGRPHIPLTHERFAKAAKKAQARDSLRDTEADTRAPWQEAGGPPGEGVPDAPGHCREDHPGRADARWPASRSWARVA